MAFDLVERAGIAIASPFFKDRSAVESTTDARKEHVKRLMRSTCMVVAWGMRGAAEYPDPKLINQELKPLGGGSGSVVAVEGRTVTILTNAHVSRFSHISDA